MTVSEVGTVVGVTIGVGGVLIAAGRLVFSHFHATQVKPLFTEVLRAVGDNTNATAGLTKQLDKTNATQVEGQRENRQAFERMGTIIADHETRLSVVEEHVPSLRPRRGAA